MVTKMEELNQRMIIVGDSGVGKTSFMIRWARKYFVDDGYVRSYSNEGTETYEMEGKRVTVCLSKSGT